MEETAIQKICELVENLQDVEIVGKIPENISAERIMRGLDPKGGAKRSIVKSYGTIATNN